MQRSQMKDIQDKDSVVINIGCGRRRIPGAIGIDNINLPSVDIVADIEQGLPFLEDNSVDIVIAESILEHVDNFESLIREVHRVLKPEGELRVEVPHFSNPYYFSDYTHKRFFGLYTFDYFVDDAKQTMKRSVPDYYTDIRFTIESREIFFYSPFRWRRKLLKIPLTYIVNLNRWVREFYEENLCWLFPCYGLKFIIKPVK
jgi:predicted SAM-dependent methyltransferase